jgi:hypothetical protein
VIVRVLGGPDHAREVACHHCLMVSGVLAFYDTEDGEPSLMIREWASAEFLPDRQGT